MATEPTQAVAPSESQPGDGRHVVLTGNAARHVAALRRAQGDEGLMLRVSVSGGGCSGFQYGFSFDHDAQDDDHRFERDGVVLLIDDVSLDLLNGAEIDFVEELIGASFQIRNPNASSSCGCGTSFAI